MKQWMKVGLGALAGVAVIYLVFAIRAKLDNLLLEEPTIHIKVEGESAFLTELELVARLKQANHLFVDQRVNQLNPENLERFIQKMNEVKSVNVFTSFGGRWNIDLELRRPIARIFNNYGQTFYLDSEGNVMEQTAGHTARVVVVSGDIPDRITSESVNEIINNDSLKSIRKLDDVYRISNYVCNDPLMNSLIGQIYRANNGDFILIPLVGGQKINFGSAKTTEEVNEKFKKLKIFYKEAIPYEGWNKYSEISLKYKKQIVCKKIE